MKKLVYSFLFAFIYFPLLTLLYLTLIGQWSFPQLLDANFHFKNWISLTKETSIWTSLGLSLFIATFLASLATIFGFVVSQALSYQKKGNLYLQFAYYPYLIAPVILGAMLQFYFVRLNLSGTILGVLIAQSFFILPYSVLLMATFWNDTIRQFTLQAKSLGANTFQIYQSVLLPLAKPWLFLVFVQCFLISWFEYGVTQLIGVGKVNTLPIQAMQLIREANPHQAALIACFMIFPILFLLGLNQQTLMKKEGKL